MSDEGEKTCPLCAEEMDFTDQQLKPCKCGYEICVWCWHHIMDMAEKDHTEGRCPACRCPYNKEKIVGTGPNSERLVADINAERRHKPHKGKSKASEGRKQLGSVRVIQRNLVYVVGLPLTFADEELLQRRDHFGQYGKVLKVSISRTASGAIQQFPNSTCSVYITYSKEEEAVRCIQSVHGFVLDSRSLKACFGTTKYCHAWLRSMPCANPDCLYLHEIGSQEDSFSKDEIVSAFTRVQQITGPSNSSQRRSGNSLPPPADEYCNDVPASVKPVIKTAINTNQNLATSISPPNSSSGRSAALPAGASWGARSSTSQTMPTSTPCSVGPVKPKPDSSNGPVAVSTAVATPSQIPSLRSNTGKKSAHNEEATTTTTTTPTPQDKTVVKDDEPTKVQSNTNKEPIAVHANSLPPTHSETSPVNKQPRGPLSSKLPSNSIHIINSSATSPESAFVKDSDDAGDGGLGNICSSILSMSVHENQQLQSSSLEHIMGKQDSLTSVAPESTAINTMPSPQKPLDLHEVEDDLLSFDNQRVNDPEITINRMHDFSNMFHLSKHSHLPASFLDPVGFANGDLNRQVVDRDGNFIVSGHHLGHSENMLNRGGIDNGGYSNIFPSGENGLHGYDEFSSETVNAGESSIISDILSMDDPWDAALTSPSNLARLFPKSDTQGSYGAPGPRKTQYNDQSKFSFAREQEHMNHVSDFRQPVDYFEQAYKQQPAGHEFSSGGGLHLENSITRNGFPTSNSSESDIFANNHLLMNKNAAPRSQILPPPGFSGPSRPPPPGFTSQGRTEQTLDMPPANHMFDASSLSRYQYSAASSNNSYNNGDIEFMDPAILAVGKGTLASGAHNSGLVDIMSSFNPQSSTYEEARFQSLLQRSLPPHQNQRFADVGDRFSNHGDTYGLPTRVVDHALANNRSPYSQFTQSMSGMNSNGQWDNWNEMQGGNNLGMAELLRNERLGYNNFYGGYEDNKLRMPSSGNLYNGAYGI